MCFLFRLLVGFVRRDFELVRSFVLGEVEGLDDFLLALSEFFQFFGVLERRADFRFQLRDAFVSVRDVLSECR